MSFWTAIRSRADSARVVALVLACVTLLPLSRAHATGEEFVTPPGQESLVGPMLGTEGPIGGCALDTVSIEQTRIRANYHCPTQTNVHIVLAHPLRSAGTLGTTPVFAISSEGDIPPREFSDALVARVRARDSAFHWRVARSDEAHSPTRDDGGRVDASARGGAAGLFRAAGLVAAAIALIVVGRRKRPLLPFAIGLSFAIGIGLASRATGDALLGASLGIRGLAFRAVPVAFAAFCVISIAAFVFSRRDRKKARDVLFLTLTTVVALAATFRIDRRPHPPRFGSLYAWAPRGHLIETDPRRPRTEYRINARGFRGSEWPERPEPGTLRGAIIGDSFVASVGLPWDGSISEKLAADLRPLVSARHVEVLNLGIPGNNLPQHVDSYITARSRLGADFIVLCLTLPNDLSDWSIQDEIRESERVGAFTLVGFAFGRGFASAWYGFRHIARSFDPRAMAILDRELARLVADRRAHGGPPLLLFGYQADAGMLRARVAGAPDVYVVPAVAAPPEFIIQGDGHPTTAGNDAYARRMLETLQSVPTLSGRFVR